MSNIGREDLFYALSCCIGVDLLEMICIFCDVRFASYFTMRLSPRKGFKGAQERLLWRQVRPRRLALGRLRPLHGLYMRLNVVLGLYMAFT